MITQKHEEGNHTDTINEANTQIVLQKLGYDISEKEPDTIEENPTPSYDGDSPGKEVTANQVETEKQDGKDHQQDMMVDKQKHDAKKSTDDSNEDATETGQKGTDEKDTDKKGTTQKGQHHMPPEAEREQERNNTRQGISSSIEAGKTIET
jgi:hypothetical protein